MDWNRLQRKEKKTLFCSVFAPCPALYPNIQSPPHTFPDLSNFSVLLLTISDRPSMEMNGKNQLCHKTLNNIRKKYLDGTLERQKRRVEVKCYC